MNKKDFRLLFLTTSLFLSGLLIAYGQSENALDTVSTQRWSFKIEPYFMFPNMSGDVGFTEQILLGIDVSPADIFSQLKFGAMLYGEAKSAKWAITSDLVFMKLEQSAETRDIILSASLLNKQFIWEGTGLYQLNNWLEAGVGIRFMKLTSEAEGSRVGFEGPVNFSFSNSENLFDPIVVARLSHHINDRWSLRFRADVGGFGISSDITWQLQGDVAYNFSELFHLALGYRSIQVDYDNGSGPQRFVYDVNTFGPVIKMGFTF